MLHFEEAAFGTLLRTGNGAGGEQVARREVATVARVVGEQLVETPIEIAKICLAQLDGCEPCRSHLVRLKIYLKSQIDAGVAEIAT